MYEQYLSIETIPAGAVLKRILEKEQISQKQLSEKCGIIPQRLHDYIKNKRKITPKVSLQLEKTLGISIPGFFYRIQTQYEITQAQRIIESQNHPNLQVFRPELFWDTHIDSLQWIFNKNWIIQRVFEYGNESEILETIDFYGKDTVKQVITNIHSTWNKTKRNKNYHIYIEHE
jgi:addiction module HigA family antidote